MSSNLKPLLTQISSTPALSEKLASLLSLSGEPRITALTAFAAELGLGITRAEAETLASASRDRAALSDNDLDGISAGGWFIPWEAQPR